MNKVILSGHIGQDVELKQLKKISVSEFSLATKRYSKKENGNITDWHNIKLFNHEKLVPFLKKGSRVLIEGFISTDSWKKDNRTFYKAVVTVDKIELMSVKSNNAGSDSEDDNIPF